MNTHALLTLIFTVLTASFLASAQETPATPKPTRTPKGAAFAPVEDVTGLPRVLLIGDSISIGYTLDVRLMLKGKANVHRIPINGGPTSRGVADVAKWIAGAPGSLPSPAPVRWDVIHFNFGLHDLVYMGPDGARLVDPASPGAHHQVSQADYEKNLKIIVDQLKATGAKVIWCNTTPVAPGTKGRKSDESEMFNEAAAKVMQAAGVPTNDLHAHAKAKLAEVQLPQNVHFSPLGSKYLAEKVAAEIEKALP